VDHEGGPRRGRAPIASDPRPLSGTWCDDVALAALVGFPRLGVLRLEGTLVTPQAIDRLARARPDLQIV
jgi:hypothetical protein